MSIRPLVLCGPIVRRVDRSTASVFLVLGQPRDVSLHIHEKNGTIVMSGTRRTIKLGENLYAVTVVARRQDALEWGQGYSYNIQFSNPDAPGQTQSLYDDDILTTGPSAEKSELERLVYEGERLPSFMLPPTEPENIRILHGSCRKPHGNGRDALAQADRLLQQAGLGKRAQQLYLTGDQIYADDVDDGFAKILQKAALVYRNEELILNPAKTRKEYIQEHSGFTSTSCANHLITLGEFYAMYMCIFSQVPWLEPPSPGQVRSFYNDLPHVRRLLANTPTYMIFDDHEVTDDWFLSKAWCDTTLSKAKGRRIIRNALVAYAVFQHWGNDPDQFEDSKPGAKLLGLIDGWKPGDSAPIDSIEKLLGIPKTAAELEQEKPEAITWSYSLRTPVYQSIVLDTRMRRAFDPASGAIALMSKNHIARLVHTSNPSRFTLIVSAAPVLGLQLIEGLQSLLEKLGFDYFNKKFDNEAWVNSWSYEFLVGQLLSRSPCVVLSGDVHFSVGANILKKDSAPIKCLVNFTSSAIQNAPNDTATWVLEKTTEHNLESGILGSLPEMKVLGTPQEGPSEIFSFADFTVPHTQELRIEGEILEESLMVSDSGGKDRVFATLPELNIPEATAKKLEATIPHQNTAAAPGSNVGELSLDMAKGRIVQRMLYFNKKKGQWLERVDTAKFPLKS